jgi:hypothetical protein
MMEMLLENLAMDLEAVLEERQRQRERESWQNEMAFLQARPMPMPKIRFFDEIEEGPAPIDKEIKLEEFKKEIELSLRDRIKQASSKFDLRNLFMEVMMLEDPMEKQELRMAIKDRSGVLDGR